MIDAMRRRPVGGACAFIALMASVPCGERAAPAPLTLATTSVGNSGLLEPLAEAFRRQHGIEVRSHLAGERARRSPDTVRRLAQQRQGRDVIEQFRIGSDVRAFSV
jgi:hypothetical protein